MQKERGAYYIFRSKRLLDIVVSLAVLILTLPFSLLVLLLIKTEHVLRGRPFDPLFYSETRMSYGQPFQLIKFNIFKYEQILAAQKNGVFIHTKDYEHNGGIIKVGWVLKQIYMDELPQFFSVLKGDLSIVGPRPVNIEVHRLLKSRGITDKDRVPAGITGPFQSYKGMSNRGADVLDQEYADYYHSQPWYKILKYDLRIMMRTILVVLRAKGI